MNGHFIATLQSICRALSSLATHFDAVKLTGIVFVGLAVDIFPVNYRKAGDRVATVELLNSHSGFALFASDGSCEGDGSHFVSLGR